MKQEVNRNKHQEFKRKISELSKESKTNLTNKTSSIEINPLRIEDSLKKEQQQQQPQQLQLLLQKNSSNEEKTTSQNHFGNKLTRSKKTKILPKAKNKTDTKHKVNKNNRMVSDTSIKMKETRMENSYKRSHQNLRVLKYKKESKQKISIWKKTKMIQKFQPNSVVPKQIHQQ